ncbi:UDP-N-acetylmuramoyl-tripeptide--D-alanyl-D-alanine ligase [Spiribacter vilamensis]|uniref:UDP-N-acetylmuramoyl-tripeptide--D-alanyl-D-alanine ligase n=1 Tax=Spiribacter vilamensis TaxID=531306 RepID=A0A4Q8CY63_9GAMM|nr:UDP-N-acetylmuramoyl-tripeptide--D-alanyl-D-alanine ligase [Spiribacter vilamensis]RZU97909.1 UDP-N-acetylmuramoyl-tripeptide--D-alanyl-D-alanine ligase [Spiribacter vilamensis]TVO61177.1 UDP-N-acetylmuramoyl-tripeptide--D-alanyl-D-alanine ligase [Spiribacter vilamensis]
MEPIRLRSLTTEFGGECRGAEVSVTGVAIDSRQVAPGDLFIALAGDRVDGHDYIDAAASAGAVAALVTRYTDSELPQWRVDNPHRILIELACRARSASGARVLGVTGSNGKTTVKEMITTILARCGTTRSTRGNLNNELGVPLTLCGIEPRDDFAVVEMGCGKPGDIGLLASWARPHIGVVTNAGPAHLTGFGSVAAVADCKGELFEELPARGWAIINADDPHAPVWEQKAAHCHIQRFSLDGNAAEVTGIERDDGGLDIRFEDMTVTARLPLPGRHNRSNALAAAAAARAAGADPETIVAGLAAVSTMDGRLQLRAGIHAMEMVDDSYNANPASLAAALETLTATTAPVWLVMGDMAELGEEAASLHRRAGEYAREIGVERLFATGELSAHAVEGFGAGGDWFASRSALIEAVTAAAVPGVRVLVKGSRSAAMDEVAAALAGDEPGEGRSCS